MASTHAHRPCGFRMLFAKIEVNGAIAYLSLQRKL